MELTMFIRSTPVSKLKIAHLFIIGVMILLSFCYLFVSLIVAEGLHIIGSGFLLVALIYYFAWELDKC